MKKQQMRVRLLVGAIAATFAGSAAAFTFETESIQGSFDSALSLGVGVRAKSPGCDTVIGTFAGTPSQPTGSGAPNGCLEALSFYNDQGNLNYEKGDVFTQYLKGTHELLLRMPDGWKFFGRANWVADFAATHESGLISGGNTTGESFPSHGERELAFKGRLLDFWVNKEFELAGEQARVRVGNQVISWGESLFLPGGINQTNAMDIMRLSQPGTQLKEVMLPAPMVSFASGLGHGVNVEAYVQTHWNKSYFPPVGSYFSTSTIGNGASDYGPFSTPSSDARNSGQFGFSLRYQPKDLQASFGAYAMRYHDKTPVVSYADPVNGLGGQFTFLEDRMLYGLSANFALGNWAIGTELSYRPEDAVALNALGVATDGRFCINGGKCYSEEEKYQLHLTGLLSITPGDHGAFLDLLGADTATLLAEAVVVSYPNLKQNYRGVPVAAGYWGWGFLTSNDVGFTSGPPSVGDKTSWGYNFDFSWTYDGTLIPGWQVTPEIYYFQAMNGRTPNAMGLFMEGAKAANVIVTFTQNPANWVIGVNYAKFWGGASVLDQPLRDRDFFGAYITRNF